MPTASLAEGASNVRLSDLRGEWIELADEIVVINDCYNANPISMRAALDHLAETAAASSGRRAVAVLGEMGELGPRAPEFHQEVGAYAAEKGVAALVAVGTLAEGYGKGYGDAGQVRRAADAAEAAAIVKDLLEPRDVVLVKGSRSVGLEQVAAALSGASEGGG